jgi:hypothetical protein
LEFDPKTKEPEMNVNRYFIAAILSVSTLFSACGGSTETPQNTANSTANANSANTNASDILAVRTPTPEQTTNNAPTLTPVYKAYCAAMVNKDEAALRRIYSSDTLRYFQSDMKETGEKTLVEYLSTEQVSIDLCEVRNEQINGDTAIAEIRSKGYPNGIKVVFVKEGGEWKLTNRSPAIESVNRSGK